MTYSKELEALLNEVFGNDTYGKAEIKTGVSRSYWVYLLKGKVPRAELLEKIIEGYNLDSNMASKLYEACSYAIPAKYLPKESPDEQLKRILNEIRLEKRGKSNPRADEQIIKFVKEKIAENHTSKIHSK